MDNRLALIVDLIDSLSNDELDFTFAVLEELIRLRYGYGYVIYPVNVRDSGIKLDGG